MSIILGLTKGNSEEDRKLIAPIANKLVEDGYVRRILVNDDDAVIQTFTKENLEVLPAYVVDKIVKESKK
jgi:hypothetical protein